MSEEVMISPSSSNVCARRTLVASVIAGLAFAFVGHAVAADIVYDAKGFDKEQPGLVPSGWKFFNSKMTPAVNVSYGGASGSQQSVMGQRSNSRGLTALSREFAAQKRVMIEFSFAFSETRGRSLNVWTHEPKGKDASQLNLCIQGGALMQFDGRTRAWTVITKDVRPTLDTVKPVWHRLRAIVDSQQGGIDYWISKPGSRDLPKTPITRHAYRTKLPIAAIDLVSGTRISAGAWYLIDDLVVTGGKNIPEPHKLPPLPGTVKLWTGPPIPTDLTAIPFVSGATHKTIHQATKDGYKFLHGAAIVQHKGVLYANWANSPTNENGPHETLQGRRSKDKGETWSDLEVIGPGFKTNERHSHGVLFVHKQELWTICSRFGARQPPGKRFPGLQGEAFVLDEKTDRWKSRGIVMKNCWPYDQPVRMPNGNFITGGQDKDGLPVVAISHGDDFSKWDSVLIPYDSRLKPAFAETTVCVSSPETSGIKTKPEKNTLTAIIRGGSNVAWVATSKDSGRTWSKAGPSNLPMPRSKAYFGKLSTGQLYLISNLKDRNTLVISVSKPGEQTLSKMWRIRHGKSVPPRYPGGAKGKQWSYPYAHEYDGQLYVVYSIGKEDCGLSVLPIQSLKL
jgi:hypothetical protein